jgi:hypothetical protein
MRTINLYACTDGTLLHPQQAEKELQQTHTLSLSSLCIEVAIDGQHTGQCVVVRLQLLTGYPCQPTTVTLEDRGSSLHLEQDSVMLLGIEEASNQLAAERAAEVSCEHCVARVSAASEPDCYVGRVVGYHEGRHIPCTGC